MVSRQIITDNKADVVSMSFGEAELFYTKEFNGGIDFTYLPKIMDDIFAQGNAQGISFFASSGDSGALAAVPLICFDGGPKLRHRYCIGQLSRFQPACDRGRRHRPEDDVPTASP